MMSAPATKTTSTSDDAAPVIAPRAAAPIASPIELKFADPTALGLFGLAIACAALLPTAFGMKSAMTADAFRTVAVMCLVFGGGCQLLAGLMSFANRNMLGGTLLTTFSFNWIVNWWAFDGLVQGKSPSTTVVMAVDVCFLFIFFAMTYAFAFQSWLLVVFLVDVDVLYVMRIIGELTQTRPALAMPIAIATLVLTLISLYVAAALVLVNAAGKTVLPLGGPVLRPAGNAAHETTA